MLSEYQRKKIARNFLAERFVKPILPRLERLAGKEINPCSCFELWRTYKSQINNNARAFTPYPVMYVTGSTYPYIAVAETKEEAIEIMNKETPEDRLKCGFPEIEQYGKYWVVYD